MNDYFIIKRVDKKKDFPYFKESSPTGKNGIWTRSIHDAKRMTVGEAVGVMEALDEVEDNENKDYPMEIARVSISITSIAISYKDK